MFLTSPVDSQVSIPLLAEKETRPCLMVFNMEDPGITLFVWASLLAFKRVMYGYV